MTNPTVETPDAPVESRVDKLMSYANKHKTTIILGAALAASVTLNFVRNPLLPPLADANWYALTHEDVKYLNALLENSPDFNKF